MKDDGIEQFKTQNRVLGGESAPNKSITNKIRSIAKVFLHQEKESDLKSINEFRDSLSALGRVVANTSVKESTTVKPADLHIRVLQDNTIDSNVLYLPTNLNIEYNLLGDIEEKTTPSSEIDDSK